MADVEVGAVAPVEPVAPATPAPEVPADQESAAPQEGEQQEKPEKTYTESEHRKALQERLGREQRRLERVARAEAERDLYRKQLEELQRPQRTDQPAGEPRPEDFQGKTYEEFTKAQIAYALQQERAKWERESQEQQQHRQALEAAKAARERLKPAESKYPDFKEVALADEVPITQPMAAFIATRDTGGDVAYYLGSNLDEAHRISRLSPVDQVLALRDLETKLSAAPTPTKTPPPIVPNAGKVTSKKDTFELSVNNNAEWNDFVKRRHKELGRR